MAKNYWLLKSEPNAYSWEDLLRDGSEIWDGVRNHTAKKNLIAMRCGDQAFFYHSNTGKECVGIVEIIEESFPDPTAAPESPSKASPWVVVRVKPVRPLSKPVRLATIKAEPKLSAMALVRQSRLSVAPVRSEEWALILEMAGE